MTRFADLVRTNERLGSIAAAIGRKYGYVKVSASFLHDRYPKNRWCRTFDSISFRISDYLKDSPSWVIEGMFIMMFESIVSGETAEYPDELVDYMGKSEFYLKNQDKFISRLVDAKLPRNNELERIVTSLELKGVARHRDLENFKFVYAKSNIAWYPSHISGVVVVSDGLAGAPESVLETLLTFAIYDMLHGFDPNRKRYKELVKNRKKVNEKDMLSLLDCIQCRGLRTHSYFI